MPVTAHDRRPARVPLPWEKRRGFGRRSRRLHAVRSGSLRLSRAYARIYMKATLRPVRERHVATGVP
jgi:hypothetical protein